MTTLAEELAWCLSALRYDSLPPPAALAARDCVADWLSAALYGTRSPEVAPLAAVARALGGAPQAGALPGFVTSAPLAALVNGTCAHAYDFDDTSYDCMVHVGAPVVAAALAAAELVQAGGRELLTAVTAGYEAAVRIGMAINSPPRLAHHKRGFHPTGTCGVFGAAAAAGLLIGLDGARQARAFGICGSLASGILEFFSDGSMTKRLHPGKAAHDGMLAALLAAEGFTGPARVLEGRDGFFRAYGDGAEPERLVVGLGETWHITRTARKFYACCAHTHASMDAVQGIVREHGLAVADIERIDVRLATMAAYQVAEPLARKQAPRGVLEAQMSLPYSLAVVLLDGRAFPAQFAPARIADPAVRALAQRIGGSADPALDARFSATVMPAVVTVQTRSGGTYTASNDSPSGSIDRQLTPTQMEEKFRALAGEALPPPAVDHLWQALQHLEALPRAATLTGR